MLCTSEEYLFSLGNYLGTSLNIGNSTITKVTSVELMDMVRVRVACNTRDLWTLISRVLENIYIFLEL